MKNLLLLFMSICPFFATSAWISTTSKVVDIVTYAHTETVLVTLSDPGSTVQECSSKVTFAIGSAVSPEGRARMYSLLLTAKTTNSNVTVSYSDVGNCEPWDANPTAYRKIVRLR